MFVSETTIYIGGFRNKQKNLFAGSSPNRSCQSRQRNAGLLPLVRRPLTGSSSASYCRFVPDELTARGLAGGEGELRQGRRGTLTMPKCRFGHGKGALRVPQSVTSGSASVFERIVLVVAHDAGEEGFGLLLARGDAQQLLHLHDDVFFLNSCDYLLYKYVIETSCQKKQQIYFTLFRLKSQELRRLNGSFS